MNPMSIEASLCALILTYAFMSCIFMIAQRQGLNFVASFDKAFVWGSCLFVAGYSLDTVVYVAWI